jgi:hypothetical protein
MVYVVSSRLSQDLRTESGKATYANFVNAVTALGPWSDRMADTWIVETKLSASRIRDLLKPHLKANDRLFVAQITQNWASFAMGPQFPAWIRRRDFTGPAGNATAAPAAEKPAKAGRKPAAS